MIFKTKTTITLFLIVLTQTILAQNNIEYLLQNRVDLKNEKPKSNRN